jgi:hypothetical protein
MRRLFAGFEAALRAEANRAGPWEAR